MSENRSYSKTYKGRIFIHPYGEYDNALFLSEVHRIDPFLDVPQPLMEVLKEDKDGLPYLTVHYWISDVPLTRDQLIENTIKQVMGIGKVEFLQHYSSITGYLWTDEDFNVGGHDLEAEIRSSVGKWLYMEITYSD